MTKSELGSSPRLRGTRQRKQAHWPIRWFIPAPAGNTTTGSCAKALQAVHPRACGEHVSPRALVLCVCGSSPRLRGTPGQFPVGHAGVRFIPAPAGNTRAWTRRRPRGSVHPRACGEHNSQQGTRVDVSGSSPRLRGTPHAARRYVLRERFIPAPAGNTSPAWRSWSPGSVHPRACGEHASQVKPSSRAIGSSPRLRGTHLHLGAEGLQHRFIPAPAGNTSTGSTAATRSTVHPRACGEHISLTGISCSPSGSSPRLRGTLQSYASDRQWKIPIAAIYRACRSVSPGWSGRGLAALRCRAAGCRRHGGWWPGGWR